MPDKKKDRPLISELTLNEEDGLLKVRWEPNEGPWGIFKDAHINSPQQVNVTEWWLYVGTKAILDRPDDKEKDEPSRWEIFNQSVGTKNEMTIPWDPLPIKQKVFARVIGYFESEDISGTPFKEGIYSDVAWIQMPQKKPNPQK